MPGLAEHGLGFKTLAEAIALRNRALFNLEIAESLDDPEQRRPYLTFVFVGAGYAGVEGIAELQDFVADVIERYPRCRLDGTRWILVEAQERIMPEIPPSLAEFATAELRARGIEVRTNTRVNSRRRRVGGALDRRAHPDAHALLDRRGEAARGGARARPAAQRARPDRGRLVPARAGLRQRVGDRRRRRGPRPGPEGPRRRARRPPSTRCARARSRPTTSRRRSATGACGSSATRRSACSSTWAATRRWPRCWASSCAASRRGSPRAPTTWR